MGNSRFTTFASSPKNRNLYPTSMTSSTPGYFSLKCKTCSSNGDHFFCPGPIALGEPASTSTSICSSSSFLRFCTLSSSSPNFCTNRACRLSFSMSKGSSSVFASGSYVYRFSSRRGVGDGDDDDDDDDDAVGVAAGGADKVELIAIGGLLIASSASWPLLSVCFSYRKRFLISSLKRVRRLPWSPEERAFLAKNELRVNCLLLIQSEASKPKFAARDLMQ